MATVTCETDGCSNAGIGIDLELTYTDETTGETVTVDAVACGVCGQPISAVVA